MAIEASGDGVDLWARAEQELVENPPLSFADRNVVFVGAKQSGKTSLISRFINPQGEIAASRPTVGLAYRYALRPHASGLGHQTLHFWELGGGVQLSELLQAVIRVENLDTLTFVIVLNLGEPQSVLPTLTFWLDAIRSYVQQYMANMAGAFSGVPSQLLDRALCSFGLEHRDKVLLGSEINLSSVPIVVMANKYDLFRSSGPLACRTMASTLRYFCHTNGASLLYGATQDKRSMDIFRHSLASAVLSTAYALPLIVDPNNALVVAVGQDSMSSIGAPPIPEGSHSVQFDPRTMLPEQLWSAVFCSVFPPLQDASVLVDYDQQVYRTYVQELEKQRKRNFEQFKEPAVDTARARREAELSVALNPA
eukprot:gnl/Spiro4/15399_TR8288_c0_g1_i1.p1 gnl/Spiro4/15399_TR8288_c0_g1~~gnl/Spiro4/15399_TR8288_c0_g1_i1.p1  ORF type:complete len:366 (+),score=63.44 gnl/Spiro4/15399_TR8288_c0_g1_i1:82-1179(+)